MLRARQAGGASAAHNGYRGRVGAVSAASGGGWHHRYNTVTEPCIISIWWHGAGGRGQGGRARGGELAGQRSWRPRRESWRGQCSTQWTQRTSWRAVQSAPCTKTEAKSEREWPPAPLHAPANSPSSSSPFSPPPPTRPPPAPCRPLHV